MVYSQYVNMSDSFTLDIKRRSNKRLLVRSGDILLYADSPVSCSSKSPTAVHWRVAVFVSYDVAFTLRSFTWPGGKGYSARRSRCLARFVTSMSPAAAERSKAGTSSYVGPAASRRTTWQRVLSVIGVL